MNMEDDEITGLEPEVREIAKLLSRAAKNYQMYLSNNRMFTTSLENLKNALENFLEENEVLTFVVREFELLHQNEQVYSNTDKYQSIAFRMYRDGIRLISFHKGITNEDLLIFFEALTKCMETDNLEEDFVTLLWEKDLQAITYYEVNDFEADYESMAAGPSVDLEPKPQINATTLSQAPWNRITTETEELKPTITLTAEDLDEVRDLSIAVEDDLFLKRAGQVLVNTLEIDSGPDTYEDMEAAFNGYLDTCVSRKRFGLAAEMLKDLRKRYEKYEDREVEGALLKILLERHSEKNIAEIGAVLASGRETECEQVRVYISLFSSQALPAVFSLLPQCTQQSARHALVSALATIGRANPVEIVKCADTVLAEEVELAIDVLEAIGTETALGCTMKFDYHSSPRVRAKVAALAARLGTRQAREVVASLIHDDDHSVRRRALTSLVEMSGDKSVDTLINLFTKKEFHQLSHDSKLSMLLVIKMLSPSGQQKVLDSVFRIRTFFTKKPVEDTKAALTEIAHLMSREVAQESLKWLAKHSTGRLRQAAKTALKKVEHGTRKHRSS
jgi:HEAT repeat protein